MFKAILISLVVGAFATSFAEYKLNYNLVDFLKDKIVSLLKRIPVIGKFFAAILAVALMLWAASSAKKPVKPSPHSAFCCGLPTPKPMPSVAPER